MDLKLICLCAAIGFASVSTVEGAQPGNKFSLTTFDADNDGAISYEDLEKCTEGEHSTFDANWPRESTEEDRDTILHILNAMVEDNGGDPIPAANYNPAVVQSRYLQAVNAL